MIAVLFHKDTSNKSGYPPEWPAEVKELREGDRVEAPWVAMSPEAYKEHRAKHQAEYDTFRRGKKRRQRERKQQEMDIRYLQSFLNYLEACERCNALPMDKNSVEQALQKLQQDVLVD